MLQYCEVDIMSKVGVSTSRRTKFNSTNNNPFQGPTAVTITDRTARGSPFSCLLDPFDPTSTQVRNASIAFNIRRLKASDPGGPGAFYGDNRRLYLGLARMQEWEPRTPMLITIGVNNNGILQEEDGVVLLRINSNLDGKEVPCFGNQEGGQTPFLEGIYTKGAAENLPLPVVLGANQNFKFSVWDSVLAANPGTDPSEIRGYFFIPEDVIGQLVNPGDEIELTLTLQMVYQSQSTGGEVALEDCNIILRLYYSD